MRTLLETTHPSSQHRRRSRHCSKTLLLLLLQVSKQTSRDQHAELRKQQVCCWVVVVVVLGDGDGEKKPALVSHSKSSHRLPGLLPRLAAADSCCKAMCGMYLTAKTE